MLTSRLRLRPLGRRLRIARISAGFSIQEWAEELELDPAHYEQVELGRVAPDVETIAWVAHLTNRSADWLLTGRSPDNDHPEDD